MGEKILPEQDRSLTSNQQSHEINKKKLFSDGAAWMNGSILPLREASIPVNDWGLVRSDITYDVVPVRDGAFFRLNEYLDRFHVSMTELNLDPEMNKEEIRNALVDLVSASGLQDSYVSMVCSRGVPFIPGSRDPRECRNYFYAWCVPYIYVIKPEIIKIGATALISDSVRRIERFSVDPTVKNYHWGDFTRGLYEAKEQKYETVLLTDTDNNITEGPGFNVFAIKDAVLITPEKGILLGITRRTVLEIAEELNISTQVRSISKSELLESDEVFLSTSAGGIIPLVKVNQTIYSNGKPGPLTEKISVIYWQWMNLPRYRTLIAYK